jgi:hypothetical protein
MSGSDREIRTGPKSPTPMTPIGLALAAIEAAGIHQGGLFDGVGTDGHPQLAVTSSEARPSPYTGNR